MKYLSIGAQELSRFKERDYIYVDKTEIIHNLFTTGRFYFLSRPRRFGKSLLVSTLKEIFLGNKELFKDLWIYNKIKWNKHPVIHIDFSKIEYRELGLKKALELYLDNLAEKHNIVYKSPVYSGKFLELIEKLFKDGQVVILIDEYDKPIIDFLEKNRIDEAEENREILKNFYSGLKAQDKYIKFLLITGVSKFSQVSIFSDLNHLNDITIHNRYSTLLGYTKEEIIKFYGDYIDKYISSKGISENEFLKNIESWYNGYSWDGINFVYNPFSIIKFFDGMRFKNYWFKTGTPTFLVNAIKSERKYPEMIGSIHVTESFFDKFDLKNLDIISLMFQTGYSTIKEYDEDEGSYKLEYPNREVEESFLNNLLEVYSNKTQSDMGNIIIDIKGSLNDSNIEIFLNCLKSLFASIPYDEFLKNYEGYYHSIIYIALKIIGVYIDCEVHTNKGRTDAVIKTAENIYVIEFKMGKAEEAMKQIEEKKYYEPYIGDKRKVILIGIGFDEEERNIGDYLVKEI